MHKQRCAKKWYEAENVQCWGIAPTGGTAGYLGQNRDCPAEIGTVDMSAEEALESIQTFLQKKALRILDMHKAQNRPLLYILFNIPINILSFKNVNAPFLTKGPWV